MNYRTDRVLNLVESLTSLAHKALENSGQLPDYDEREVAQAAQTLQKMLANPDARYGISRAVDEELMTGVEVMHACEKARKERKARDAEEHKRNPEAQQKRRA